MRFLTFADAAPGEGAAAMNRVFQNYLVPMNFSAEQLNLHVAYNDVDLVSSPIWLDDEGNVAAAALLGVRGKRAWIGGFGIAPEYRGQGYAKRLLEHVIETARARKLDSIALEVLKDNAAAIALYKWGGFEPLRELRSFETWVEDTPMPHGYAFNLPERYVDEPDEVRPGWQRETATLRNGAVSSAVSDASGNYAVYRFNAHLAQVLKIRAGSVHDLRALACAVAADGGSKRVMILNEPAESRLVQYALECGWNEPFKQYEMLLRL